MANDDFEEMARIGASEAKAGFDGRIERERHVQERAKRIRTTCRYIALIGALGSFGFLFLGLQIEVDALTGIGCFLFLPTVIAATVLFFMGGFAPTWARRTLTKRDRDLLDN